MILPDKLPDMLSLFRKDLCYIRCTRHLILFPVWRNKCITFFGAKILLKALPVNNVVTIIHLPHTMIKTNAICAAENSRIA